MPSWKIKIKNMPLKKDASEKYHPFVLELLKNRGIEKEPDIMNFFESGYESLGNPFDISDMKNAVARIKEAKEKNEKIVIFGDYDADGVTATALIYETLENLGFKNISVYIPDRQAEGYGINEKALENLKNLKTDLIITVDCGISNWREIKKAKELGMEIIITDHHMIPEKIPEALFIINPHIPNSGFQSKGLAGVGVAFKLAQALFEEMNPDGRDYLKWMLDIVGIGTIADCVPLLGENRILVKYGLLVLSKTRRVGLQEMFKVGRIAIDENNVPDTHKVAFQIAPRINAAGRLDHASVSYNLILEKDRAKARVLALEVESKNQERQKITSEIFREVQILAKNAFGDKNLIFAENPHWPVGILGLVSGKITDEFKKPSVILQKQENEYVGSLRSIPEINIIEALKECSDLIEKFGGHAQAAGVTISPKNIEKFYEKLALVIDKKLDGKERVSELEIDLEISPENIDWDFINELKKMEPFGQGNPEPVFLMKSMTIMDLRVCGNGSKHQKLSLKGSDGSPKIFDSIGFGFGNKFPDLKNGDKIDIVFNLKEDDWNGNKKIQLNLIDLKMHG
jgi:single-stranded-DNA-specific exonuclease